MQGRNPLQKLSGTENEKYLVQLEEDTEKHVEMVRWLREVGRYVKQGLITNSESSLHRLATLS